MQPLKAGEYNTNLRRYLVSNNIISIYCPALRVELDNRWIHATQQCKLTHEECFNLTQFYYNLLFKCQLMNKKNLTSSLSIAMETWSQYYPRKVNSSTPPPPLSTPPSFPFSMLTGLKSEVNIVTCVLLFNSSKPIRQHVMWLIEPFLLEVALGRAQ